MADTRASEHYYEPSTVLPPGHTLIELLEQIGMTQAELATRTGLSTKHVNQIAKGSAPITSETALLLERATGLAAGVWGNLEVRYREQETRRQEEVHLAEDVGWLDELPVAELIRRGFIEATASPIDRLRGVYRFFGIANRAAWDAMWQKPTAFRTSKAFNSDPGAVAAWLRIGEISAASIDCEPFSRAALMDLLPELRLLTREPDPGHWWPTLVARCRQVGVAVVGEPEIKGARINGAARWLTPDKALVQLSLRHKCDDIFWFTFFHEVGHLLLHSKKDAFINDLGKHSGVEAEADGFASQLLIPRQHEPALAQLKTIADVRQFSEQIGVAPGIVVGRLQYDKRWPYNRGNDLKQRLKFAQ